MTRLVWLACLCLSIGCTDALKSDDLSQPTYAQDEKSTQKTEQLKDLASRTEPERRDIVRLTPEAATEVRKLLKEHGVPYLRVTTKPSEYTGFQEDIGLASKIDVENDVLGTSHDISILVDRKSIPFLDGSTIDWYQNFDIQGFIVDNPNAPKEPSEPAPD